MPTITIATAALSASRRRAIALKITRWLTDRGVAAGHVVVRFEEADGGMIFTGGWPVDALPVTPGELHHASVTVCVGPQRDEDFRADLAAHIADTLGRTDNTAFFYLEFRTTPPSEVYVAAAGPLRRTDLLAKEGTP
ncbi:hypothetical protein [Actinokineospora sp. HUAS TT18]|uniref:hypothetical protein n=1 Tax=Actinokineospora sp. HUAS TT18 TaxID=3447451 RepID=UPI003F5203AD